MSDKEHIWIPKLKQQLADKKIDRREFVRYASLLGMSSGVAYMWAGKITGEPLAPPAMAQDMPKGGILKIAQRIPKVDNPHTFSWVYDSNVARQVCGYLTRTGVDNVTRPHLCEKWEASEDLKTWTLHIRKDAKWRKGDDFTAEHAAWNIKHCLDPKVGSSVVGLMKGYMLKDVDTGTKDDKGNAVMTTELWDANAIEIKDAKTLVLNLAQAQVAVPEHLFHYPFLMLDPAENGAFAVGSNGTESFDLVELEVNRKAVLKRRPDSPGFVDELHFIDLGDNPAAVAGALASKQVDGIYQGNIEQFDLYKGMPHVEIHQVVTAQTAVARMQMTQKPFDNPKVRKAIRLATDPEKCLQIAHKGVGQAAEHHHVCTVHPDYKKLNPMGYQPEEAKKLLAEAGFPDGIEIEINCKPDPSWEQAAVEAMAEQWKAGNVRAKINVLPSAKFWELWTEVPFGFTEWTHRPLGFMVLALAYRTGVPWNESRYSNAKFDELLGKAEGTLDVDKRREILGELETIMQEDGPITQPLWRSVYAAYDKRVKGFEIHPTLYIFGETLAISPA
ncbi:ABC transporter substrate-binding protein [Taklimakanibacter lacteus]|uniref:ABC transporter substrate-binding protein n=1 Tax=Taklimakanibacter lacteus TaxID=2268456 RepID=UPI000E66F46F